MSDSVCALRIDVEEGLKRLLPSARWAWAVFDNVTVLPGSSVVDERVNRLVADIREKCRLEDVARDPCVFFARDGFRRCGVDPARYRPSQEALLRRIVKGKDWVRINTAADINNFLSLKYRLALGLYDADRIEGPAMIRRGRTGESYEALNGREISMEGKVCLCDQQGALGSPYVDSRRTAVSEKTTRLCHIVYLIPPDFSSDRLESMAEIFQTVCGGNVQGYFVEGREAA